LYEWFLPKPPSPTWVAMVRLPPPLLDEQPGRFSASPMPSAGCSTTPAFRKLRRKSRDHPMKVAIVTDAGQGIGRAIALRLAAKCGDRILGVHTHECTDDAEAVLKRWALLDSSREHLASLLEPIAGRPIYVRAK
jgi:hypothetical protein